MSLHNSFDRTRHLDELLEPLETQGMGVLTPAQRQALALKNLTGGTAMTAAQLAALAGVVPGTAAASKALVLDSSLNIAGIGVAGLTRVDWDSSTATLSSNAVTITKYASVITTESLTTAHTAAATLVITKVGVAAGDIAMVSMVGGTNTGGVPVFNAVCTTDTVTITLRNNAIATNAFNGTFIFNLLIYKA